ncbi:hypothetical protein Tco_1515137 [Tanacetum coccineum]
MTRTSRVYVRTTYIDASRVRNIMGEMCTSRDLVDFDVTMSTSKGTGKIVSLKIWAKLFRVKDHHTPVEYHHNPTLLHQLITTNFTNISEEQTAGIMVSSPDLYSSSVADEVASIGMDVRYGGATTIVTRLEV